MNPDSYDACRCGHAKTNHTAGKGQCWSAVCGCSTYRPKETAK